MAKTRYVYDCSAVVDDWQIVRGQEIATTGVEARKKFRRRYKKAKSITANLNRRAQTPPPAYGPAFRAVFMRSP